MKPAAFPAILIALLLALPGRASAARNPEPAPAARPGPGPGDWGNWAFPQAGLEGPALEKARLEHAPLWINARPLLTAAEDPEGRRGIVSLDPSLEGKTVLLHFWDYTNAHCLGMVGLLEGWHRRYKASGLVIVGVHAPEFAFSANADNVNEAVKRFGISYPVYLDSDFLFWRVFENKYWPRTILVVPEQGVVYDVVGSAETQAVEKAVRNALERTRGRRFDKPLLPPLPREREGAICHEGIGDLPCGFERGRVGMPGFRKDGSVGAYEIPAHAEVRQDGVIYLEGNWRASRQALFPAAAGPWEMRLRYPAAGVALVATPPPDGAGARVRVTLDGKPVPRPFRGADLRQGPGGETYFTINSPGLMRLVAEAPFTRRDIALFPESAGIGFYVLYFKDCE